MITDWDLAYDNRTHVGNDVAEAFFAACAENARLFRDGMTAKGKARLDLAYGQAEREKLDLFLPETAPKGLMVFIHGGFWRMFDKSFWSHFATGALARGWAVTMPSYTLAPEARVSQITRQAAAAIEFSAALIEGPVRITGHSAGGHLASRMLCTDIPLSPQLTERIEHVVSISGISDVRPLMRASLNETFGFDEVEAAAESPALLAPRVGASITCWVGGAELPEFLRQNDLLANIWTGLDATTKSVHAPGKNHFTVLNDLLDAESELTRHTAP